MIVLDASVVVEFLLNGDSSVGLRDELAANDEQFIVPHLIDVEVTSAFRRLAAGRQIDAHTGEALLKDLAELPAERYGHTFLLPRIWELRNNFSSYDATYIALAELMNAVLYTRDGKLRKGHRARVKILG